jgi:cyclase
MGFDVELVKAVTGVVTIPVIASGGMGTLEDVQRVVEEGEADAVAIAQALHYNKYSVEEIRQFCISQDIPVRHTDIGVAQ